MTIVSLLKSVKAAVQQIVGTGVGVHLFFLPQKTAASVVNALPEFPYIILRPSAGKDAEDSASGTIKMLFGVQAADDEGPIDVFNYMESIRQAFLKNRVLDRVFLLDKFSWEFFDEQPYPEWIGVITTEWTLPTVREEVPNI
ncbi:hypothetical protein SAMN05216312_102218 [Cohnella sp. OV330]|uniref:hypothetical protein n=1 Tax=Cohnella sp. OV330 TaxID=1855288 RepID=UPI0008EBEC9E|nr:hypothetical protein [Cohnella sp. OV330]SFA91598.1 hypothetical protein SAMN05216312_102218 [Cohnella sp. OV330]